VTRIGSGDQTYEWIENWAKIPDSATARAGWAHPGVAVTAGDEVITFHQGDPTLLVLDRDGNLLRAIDTNLVEGHGLTLAFDGDTEYLWIADSGSKRVRLSDRVEERRSEHGQVVKLTLAGEVALTLERPDLEIYREGRYSPTAVAVNEERFGGNGDVWVADGYGQGRVHRYSRFDKRGAYVSSIDGADGAGAFTQPHGVWMDFRKSEPELYIADRRNRRIQVYDPEGRFKRAFGQDFLITPSAFARQGDYMIVAELNARLTVLDLHDRLVCYLGRNESVCEQAGWPNMLDAGGVPARTDRLVEGCFNSPHGVATDRADNIYVAEWLIGGRTVKLARVG
jgi:DNA-binding beta-propeller fold protein YncE